ncbi:MAG: hypothetical protein HKN33_03010 [Pyrinomonadaceae bacterium]|nr:hypothetical protein [Pyrinomonadaceae bacterium]
MTGSIFSRNGSSFVETTFVLFFLSLDFGQNQSLLSLEGVFMGFVIGALAVLPFFLPSAAGSSLPAWLVGRGVIVSVGVLLGLGAAQLSGAVFPDVVRFVPITMAFAAAVIACVMMFNSVLKLDFVE